MASLIFNWKLVKAESRVLKKSSEQRERQFSELLRYLRMWECLSEERCSRMRVAKCLLVSIATFTYLSGVVWTGPKEKNRDKRLKFLDDFRQFPIRLGTPDCTLTLDI